MDYNACMSTTNTIPVPREIAHAYAYGYLLGAVKTMAIMVENYRHDNRILNEEIDRVIARAKALDEALTASSKTDAETVRI